MHTQPRFRVLHHIHATAFNPAPARFRVGMLGEVVVEIKAAVQSGSQGLAIENHRANKSRRVIGVRVQQFRPGWMCGGQRHSKICDPMRTGQQAGENRGV